jgi:hypothetical protein
MRYISEKAALVLLSALVFASCRSNEVSQSSTTSDMASAGLLTQKSEQPIDVLKQYHKALLTGDSVKARSLATGTARTILEYRFFDSAEDDDLRFTYGPQSIVRDTCYIPVQIKDPSTREPASEGKAVLMMVDGEWKVERIAMNK